MLVEDIWPWPVNTHHHCCCSKSLTCHFRHLGRGVVSLAVSGGWTFQQGELIHSVGNHSLLGTILSDAPRWSEAIPAIIMVHHQPLDTSLTVQLFAIPHYQPSYYVLKWFYRLISCFLVSIVGSYRRIEFTKQTTWNWAAHQPMNQLIAGLVSPLVTSRQNFVHQPVEDLEVPGHWASTDDRGGYYR